MRFTILLAAAGALLSLPAIADESSYGRARVSEILDRIAIQDCAGAVGDLNAALKHDFAEVQLLAGSMYEHGVCVKRDWERAVPFYFYIQAWQGGDVDVRFLPGVPRIDLKLGATHTVQMSGWIDGDATREREAISKSGFKKALNEVAERALQRYPHPDGIPADMLVEVTYRFDVELAN